jgi:ABC-2 type transport system permease protein
MLSKLTSALITWSAGLWLCFGITYAYTAYYWKDDSVQSLIPTLLLWWLFSVMVICLMFFFASFLQTHIQVMICTGGVVFAMSVIGIADSVKKYLPSTLTDSMNFCTGAQSISTIIPAIVITTLVTVCSVVFSLVLIGKRKV